LEYTRATGQIPAPPHNAVGVGLASAQPKEQAAQPSKRHVRRGDPTAIEAFPRNKRGLDGNGNGNAVNLTEAATENSTTTAASSRSNATRQQKTRDWKDSTIPDCRFWLRDVREFIERIGIRRTASRSSALERARFELIFPRPKIVKRIPRWRLTFDRETFLACQENKRRWLKKNLARKDSHFRFLRFHYSR